MKTRTIYEEQILKDFQGLPEHSKRKLAKIFSFLKKEIIEPPKDEKQHTNEFLSVCGTWEDDRTVEEQIDDIYSARKSRKVTDESFEISNGH